MRPLDGIAFWVSYVVSKCLCMWVEVRRPKVRVFLYEMAYSLRKVVKPAALYPDPFGLSEVDTVHGRFKIRPHSADLATVSPAYERRDRRRLSRVVQTHLDRGVSVTFVDIGAALGTYALSVGVRHGSNPRLRIVAIEGNVDTANLLETNVALNHCNNTIEVVRAILWDRVDVQVHLCVDPMVPTSGSFSTGSGSKDDGRTTTLDHVIRRHLHNCDVLILKLDVERTEGLILAGATEVLRSGKTIELLVEDFQEPKIVDTLKSLGAVFITKLTPYNSWWRISPGYVANASADLCRLSGDDGGGSDAR